MSKVTADSLNHSFEQLCQEHPSEADLKKLQSLSDRQRLIEFTVEKINQLLEASRQTKSHSKLEWGIAHLLRHFQGNLAGELVQPAIELLDILIDNQDAVLHDTSMVVLEGAGIPALEPVYTRYQRDRRHPERTSTWLWILSDLGVQDKRIYQALLEHLRVDPEETILLMGGYGDRDALPIVEAFVKGTAKYLNDNQIDPFAAGARFDDPLVSMYINTREALVMLKEGMQPSDPEFDEKVEALDQQLLQSVEDSYADQPNGKEVPRKARTRDSLISRDLSNSRSFDVAKAKSKRRRKK